MSGWEECMDRNESELLALLASDLDSSFWQLVLRYQHMLYAFAPRLCADLQDVEDIVQEALPGAYTCEQYAHT